MIRLLLVLILKLQFFALFDVAWAEELKLPIINIPEKEIQKKYGKLKDQMMKSTCQSGTEEMYNQLLKNYRGNGYFVPLDYKDQLDRDTIKKYLPTMKEKIEWIRTQKKNIDTLNNLIEIKKNVASIRLLLNILLEQNKILNLSEDNVKKMNADNKSIEFFSELKNKYNDLISHIPYFLHYQYPTDYLALRKEYDQLKFRDDKEGVKKANEVMFLRRILEDGSANRNHAENDLSFRTTLSTLYFSFKEKNKHLTEDQRFDLDYILKVIETKILKGKKEIIARMNEWEERTVRIYQFYEALLGDEMISDNHKVKTEELARLKSLAKFKLKEFVLSKFLQVYQFWGIQDDLMISLFVIDSILYNEVGNLDAPYALERKDVADVIINRFFEERYAKLTPKDSLWNNLFMNTENSLSKHRWLNLMFKEGEFSFTYFYMPVSVRTFCPSTTRESKKLQKENTAIAINALKKTSDRYPALRYFSRESMLGRINMTKLWEDYEQLPERPGRLIKNDLLIKSKYQKNEYKLFYRFRDDRSKDYDVVEIHDKIYVKEVGAWRFYHYRSPHQFKYFKKK